MMMKKGCPRCRGDLFIDRSDSPALWSCLQCGRSFAQRAQQREAGRGEPVGVGADGRAA